MNTIVKFLQYVAAVILFFIAYGVGSFVAHLVINFLNDDARGWVRGYLLPYFVAACAGPLGVVVGFTVLEKLLPSVRLRPVVWSFTIIVGIIWLLALMPLLVGGPLEPGISLMAVQTIAALIAAFKLSAR